MNKKIETLESDLKSSIKYHEDREKYLENKSKADFTALQAENKFESGQYVAAFQLCLIAFSQYNDLGYEIMNQQLKERMGNCIRQVRANSPYILDWDILSSNIYLEYINKAKLDSDVSFLCSTMEGVIACNTKIWQDHNYSFVLYRKNIPLYEKTGSTIYVILSRDENNGFYKKEVLYGYEDLKDYYKSDLNSSFDYVGVCHCNSHGEVVAYSKMK